VLVSSTGGLAGIADSGERVLTSDTVMELGVVNGTMIETSTTCLSVVAS